MSLYVKKTSVCPVMAVNPVAEDDDVIFIDYDGVIRHSFTAAEFAALSALPPNPKHEGLTAQGWNWTLADAKDYVSKYGMQVIGQNYVTTSGETELYINLTSPKQLTISLNYRQTVASGVEVDFGDGSQHVVETSSNQQSVSHTYSALGKYVIKMKCLSGSYSLLGANASNLFGTDPIKQQILTDVRLGTNAYISQSSFSGSYFLSTITVTATTNHSLFSSFEQCRSLKAFVVPTGETLTNSTTFNNCYSMEYVSLPKSATFFSWRCFSTNVCLKKICIPENVTAFSGESDGRVFYGCYTLAEASIGEGVTVLYNQTFYQCQLLKRITIPESIATINTYALASLYSILEMRFKATSPASVTNSDAFANLNAACLIYVPFSALAGYLGGTNYPDPATYTYIGYATYNSGAALPAQDGTEAYNVTWYANKADAVAQTNAITTGTGNEIYCRYTAVT